MKALHHQTIWIVLCLVGFSTIRVTTAGPFQTTGIRIGEVTDNSAIIWTRLTEQPDPVGLDAPVPAVYYIQPETGKLFTREQCQATDGVRSRPDWQTLVKYPDGYDVNTIEGAVPGAPGDVRVLYKPKGTQEWQKTAWLPVSPPEDYTRQFELSGLLPHTSYELKVESKSEDEKPGETVTGGFVTAPLPQESDKVVFAITTCHEYEDQDAPGGGFKIYPHMLKLHPDFFVHTGDIIYYDSFAKNIALARWHWARTYSLPTNVEFHRQVASYFMKDDHDTWMNDCWPGRETKFMGDFSFQQGQQVFLQEVPMADSITYRTYRWGKDLQIWLVEGRDFRSPNNMPDGPDKTIWGEKQKAWFKRTVQASDATFRLLISPTPLVGPDRKSKRDNHANQGFAYEGEELRRFIASQKNMAVICGDRHWQYVSRDAETGVMEFSCGAASDEHAGGWKQDDRRPEHLYLNVVGGFLAGFVEHKNGHPVLTFRHYSVDGEILHEERLMAE